MYHRYVSALSRRFAELKRNAATNQFFRGSEFLWKSVDVEPLGEALAEEIDPVQTWNAGIECETLKAQNRLSGVFSFHVKLRRQETEVRVRNSEHLADTPLNHSDSCSVNPLAIKATNPIIGEQGGGKPRYGRMSPVIDFAAELDWLSLAIEKVAVRLCKTPDRDFDVVGVEWLFQWLGCSPFVWTHDSPIEID